MLWYQPKLARCRSPRAAAGHVDDVHLVCAKVDVSWQKDDVVIREADALPKQSGCWQPCSAACNFRLHGICRPFSNPIGTIAMHIMPLQHLPSAISFCAPFIAQLRLQSCKFRFKGHSADARCYC